LEKDPGRGAVWSKHLAGLPATAAPVGSGRELAEVGEDAEKRTVDRIHHGRFLKVCLLTDSQLTLN
jgi:hypothetical protein